MLIYKCDNCDLASIRQLKRLMPQRMHRRMLQQMLQRMLQRQQGEEVAGMGMMKMRRMKMIQITKRMIWMIRMILKNKSLKSDESGFIHFSVYRHSNGWLGSSQIFVQVSLADIPNSLEYSLIYEPNGKYSNKSGKRGTNILFGFICCTSFGVLMPFHH